MFHDIEYLVRAIQEDRRTAAEHHRRARLLRTTCEGAARTRRLVARRGVAAGPAPRAGALA